MNRTTYVHMLSEDMQEEIETELIKYFIENHNEMSIRNVAENVLNGMDSRLCDLEDTIDIEKYVTKIEG